MKQSVVAVILAAGRGLRMGGELPKQYLELEGRPILAHTLAAFDKASSIDALVIVSNDIEHVKERVLMPYPVSKPVFFVQGGEERQHSVWNAVQFIKECEASAVGMPCKDTIKETDHRGFAVRTPDRSRLWEIHTPQTFKFSLFKSAHEQAARDGFLGTDDSSLVERLGHPVKLIEGGYYNIKITTREDLELAARLLRNRGEEN